VTPPPQMVTVQQLPLVPLPGCSGAAACVHSAPCGFTCMPALLAGGGIQQMPQYVMLVFCYLCFCECEQC
jgi:hypothetical protein